MMRLSNRDKAIISDLQRFRVMSRDDITDLHFSNLKNPTNAANNVLKRLHRDNLIERNTNFVPYLYFPSDTKMKKYSQKTPHFLEIVKTYKDLIKHEQPEIFLVEPKYAVDGKVKGNVEPDCMTVWKRTPLFLEIQCTQYSEDVMKKKLERYEALYDSGVLDNETWQPTNKKVFPHVLIISETRYAIDNNYPFKVFQSQSIDQFLVSIQPKQQNEPMKQPQHTEVNHRSRPKQRTVERPMQQPVPPRMNPQTIQNSPNVRFK
jgi:hypothetical protein